MPFSRLAENLIARFRDIPRTNSMMIDRGAKPLESLIEVCLERHHIGRETAEECVLSHWKQIVGERLAHRCSPQRIDAHQNLIIAVSNPILRRELQFHEDRIMTALRSIEGCTHIRGIVLRAG